MVIRTTKEALQQAKRFYESCLALCSFSCKVAAAASVFAFISMCFNDIFGNSWRWLPVVTFPLSHPSAEFPDVFTHLRVYMSTEDGVPNQQTLHIVDLHGDLDHQRSVTESCGILCSTDNSIGEPTHFWIWICNLWILRNMYLILVICI